MRFCTTRLCTPGTSRLHVTGSAVQNASVHTRDQQTLHMTDSPVAEFSDRGRLIPGGPPAAIPG